MKLQFDANQQFQLDAVASVVDLFAGQPRGEPDFAIISTGALGSTTLGGATLGGSSFGGASFGGARLGAQQQMMELGVGNHLLLGEDKLAANTRTVQDRNDIEVADPTAALEAWELEDPSVEGVRPCPHFSVEMETGTGKTYVYLRTIFELSQKYGFQKFIIVVPSVAIREGVLKNIEITTDHFRALYNNLPFEHFVYDAKRLNRLRQFATSNTLQILIMNIDAFRSEASNVIYKERDGFNTVAPIESIRAVRPIVIIDEPQSVDSTDKAQEAIKALNPLCTLRYSATHKKPYNLVYRLDPIRAFELNLVKQIVVASVTAGGMANDAFVRVNGIDNKNGIKAKLRMHVQGVGGPKEQNVTVKHGDNLFDRSKGRANYADGYQVAGISSEAGNEYIQFSGGRTLRIGEEIGGVRDDIWRIQIKHTIKQHLEKELQVRERGLKVLSLFFIDRVANYRDYEGGQPVKGKFGEAFEAELANLAKEERYKDLAWLKEPVEKLHDGYFSQDKAGAFKDSREGRASQDDESTFNKIMRNKEQLLSVEEPLRFIFSHSALREGWDNPNVFQICTLNETRSAMKKRQEIGRGLRLPVDQNGQRVFDEQVNRLYVMANESYEDFAKALQTEYEEDCGVSFGKVPITAFARLVRIEDNEEVPIGREHADAIKAALVAQKIVDAEGRILPAFKPQSPDFKLLLPPEHQDLAFAVTDLLSQYRIERHIRRESDMRTNKLNKQIRLSPEFETLWNKIKPRTTYRVEFETDDLVYRALEAIGKMDKIEKPVAKVVVGGLKIDNAGVDAKAILVSDDWVEWGKRPLPDILAYLQSETELTRSTLVRILKESGRLEEFFNDPQRYMDAIAARLKSVLHSLLVDGIKYERIEGAGPDAEWEMLRFDNEELVHYLKAAAVSKSVHEYVEYDSAIERAFAEGLDSRQDIRLFVKLPRWFQIDTPLGKYNPDWAIVKEGDDLLYLVKETKGTKDYDKLRTSEAEKFRCGREHFAALNMKLEIAVTAADV